MSFTCMMVKNNLLDIGCIYAIFLPYKKYYGYKYSIYTTIQKFRVSGIFKKKFILLFSKDGINW